MSFTVETINRISMIGGAVAAEIVPSNAINRAWCIVFPPYPPDSKDKHFRVVRLEFTKEIIEAANNGNEIDIDELPFYKEISCSSILEVEGILNKWHVDSGTFHAPWRVGYPQELHLA